MTDDIQNTGCACAGIAPPVAGGVAENIGNSIDSCDVSPTRAGTCNGNGPNGLWGPGSRPHQSESRPIRATPIDPDLLLGLAKLGHAEASITTDAVFPRGSAEVVETSIGVVLNDGNDRRPNGRVLEPPCGGPHCEEERKSPIDTQGRVDSRKAYKGASPAGETPPLAGTKAGLQVKGRSNGNQNQTRLRKAAHRAPGAGQRKMATRGSRAAAAVASSVVASQQEAAGCLDAAKEIAVEAKTAADAKSPAEVLPEVSRRKEFPPVVLIRKHQGYIGSAAMWVRRLLGEYRTEPDRITPINVSFNKMRSLADSISTFGTKTTRDAQPTLRASMVINALRTYVRIFGTNHPRVAQIATDLWSFVVRSVRALAPRSIKACFSVANDVIVYCLKWVRVLVSEPVPEPEGLGVDILVGDAPVEPEPVPKLPEWTDPDLSGLWTWTKNCSSVAAHMLELDTDRNGYVEYGRINPLALWSDSVQDPRRASNRDVQPKIKRPTILLNSFENHMTGEYHEFISCQELIEDTMTNVVHLSGNLPNLEAVLAQNSRSIAACMMIPSSISAAVQVGSIETSIARAATMRGVDITGGPKNVYMEAVGRFVRAAAVTFLLLTLGFPVFTALKAVVKETLIRLRLMRHVARALLTLMDIVLVTYSYLCSRTLSLISNSGPTIDRSLHLARCRWRSVLGL